MQDRFNTSACENFRQLRPNRRELLKVGGIGLLGASLPQLLQATENARGPKARAKSIILLHQFGGPSHVDTLDPKPHAPEQIRGEFGTMATSAPGIFISDRLPNTARVADKFSLIRSMYHTMKNHNSAAYYSLSGHAPPLDDQRLRDSIDLFPAYGSVVDRLSPAADGTPTFAAFPHVMRDGSIAPGQRASFLGKTHDPFFFANDPNEPGFSLPELSLPANLTLERLENRREVMKLIDDQSKLLDFSATARGIGAAQEKALSLLTSPQLKKAFDLSAEPDAVREKYGRTTYGQSCLLARRLVESGVKFINVYFANSIGGRKNSGGWDTHGFDGNPMYPILKEYLIPTADQTLPTLLEDLDERGLLDETLVVWMGEFGRSPKINSIAGRDHWPQCYTALVAGGGVKRGSIYGASDKNGGYPSRDPVRPDDLAATMFYLLGINPQTEVHDPLNRPFPIAAGNPLTELLA